jgi:hypothetical protein
MTATAKAVSQVHPRADGFKVYILLFAAVVLKLMLRKVH